MSSSLLTLPLNMGKDKLSAVARELQLFHCHRNPFLNKLFCLSAVNHEIGAYVLSIATVTSSNLSLPHLQNLYRNAF